MYIFWRLILAHLLADYTFQTDYIARWKRQSMLGGVVHSSIFLVCGMALCAGYLGSPWRIPGGNIFLPGWLALVTLSLLHFLEDEWRVRVVRRLSARDTLFFFLWDQFVHVILIYAFFPRQFGQPAEKWVLLFSLFILVTHFTSILVFFIEKGARGTADISLKGKYYGMAEHLVTAMIIVLPGYWSLTLLFLWLARIIMRRLWFEQDASWLSIAAGNALALLFGFIARQVYWR